MPRFISKRPYKKIVRPIGNGAIPHKVIEPKKENKVIEKIEENDMNDKINKINEVLDVDKAPKRKVKIEKKDKGLLERTDNSTILVTEDNKMVLTD